MSDCACGFDDVDNVSFGSLPQAGPAAPSYNTLALKTVAAHPGGPTTLSRVRRPSSIVYIVYIQLYILHIS